MTGTKPAHFLVVPLAAWGHVRPLLHLSLNILITHPSLRLTLLLANSVAPRVEKELASPSCAHVHEPSSSAGGKALIERLQIIHVASEEWSKAHPVFDVSLMSEEAMEYAKVLPSALVSLYTGKGVEGQENKFASLKPDFVIFDSFQAFVPAVARAVAQQLNEPLLKMIAFCPSNAAACYHHFAPAKAGGFIEVMREKIKEETDKGMSEDEAWQTYMFYTDGRLKTIPGLTTMYDYEYFPQMGAVPLPPQLGQQVAGMFEAVNDPDVLALVIPTVEELETETNKAFAKEVGKPLLQAGLQFPDSVWQEVPLSRDLKDAEAQRVLKFLDDMLEKYGEKSVAYVSFGSAWFPAGRPELAQYLAESLAEAGVPFVFAYATEMFPVSPDLIELVKSTPNACAVQFAPQWHVLEHPATRFFVSHCGSNSTAEAILAGVSMVSHPFGADQGEFTAMRIEIPQIGADAIVEKLGVTIDLKQVKTFRNPDWKKLHNGGELIGTEQAIKEEQKKVWAAMMGPKGDEMRANMKKVREAVAKSRDSGKSKAIMDSFSNYY